MLTSAPGTANIANALSTMKILVLTVFTVIYIPCVASLAVPWWEGGWKTLLYFMALNLIVALLVAGGLARWR